MWSRSLQTSQPAHLLLPSSRRLRVSSSYGRVCADSPGGSRSTAFVTRITVIVGHAEKNLQFLISVSGPLHFTARTRWSRLLLKGFYDNALYKSIYLLTPLFGNITIALELLGGPTYRIVPLWFASCRPSVCLPYSRYGLIKRRTIEETRRCYHFVSDLTYPFNILPERSSRRFCTRLYTFTVHSSFIGRHTRLTNSTWNFVTFLTFKLCRTMPAFIHSRPIFCGFLSLETQISIHTIQNVYLFELCKNIYLSS